MRQYSWRPRRLLLPVMVAAAFAAVLATPALLLAHARLTESEPAANWALLREFGCSFKRE